MLTTNLRQEYPRIWQHWHHNLSFRHTDGLVQRDIVSATAKKVTLKTDAIYSKCPINRSPADLPPATYYEVCSSH